MTDFYAVSRILLEKLPGRFVKAEPHDPVDAESSDLLWTMVSADPTDFCEGEVFLISHYGEQWFADREDANKYGGWPSIWSTSGSADEVVSEVLDYLTTE